MGKEIKFSQKNPQFGQIEGILRIIGRELFLKVNSYEYSKQFIERFKQAGASVVEGKNWIKIDLFTINPIIKLGQYEINCEEDSIEEIEDKLYKFYLVQYSKSGMKINGGEL